MRKNILAIQMSAVSADFDTNCEKVTSLFDDFYSKAGICGVQKENRPDIVFLPEVWTLGWDTECFQECALKNKSAVEFLSYLAKNIM